MKYADLHVHTFYSDSSFSPAEVVSCAREKGLSAIAICDHDSVDGIGPSIEAASPVDIEIIPGIELTVEKPDAEIHVLGYFIDWKADWLRERLKEVQAQRVERVYRMVEKLKENGFRMEAEDVLKLAGKGTVGRLHVAQAMLKTGRAKSFREVFEKYIGFSKPCYVSSVRFSAQGAMDLILDSGGVPVLAHPDTMGRDEYIPELVSCGLRGIEVYHSDHRNSAVRHYEELAAQHKLLMTGGSDCHGLGKGRVLLGEVRIPYELVDRLKEEAERVKHERR